MLNLKEKRIKRSLKTRKKIAQLNTLRLSVHRTNLHIYAQLIDDNKNKVITSASTLDEQAKKILTSGSNKLAASYVGKTIAERAKQIGVDHIAFDRSGFKYHGRIKALAEAARENGLKF